MLLPPSYFDFKICIEIMHSTWCMLRFSIIGDLYLVQSMGLHHLKISLSCLNFFWNTLYYRTKEVNI
jgi:hypothetical protein